MGTFQDSSGWMEARAKEEQANSAKNYLLNLCLRNVRGLGKK